MAAAQTKSTKGAWHHPGACGRGPPASRTRCSVSLCEKRPNPWVDPLPPPPPSRCSPSRRSPIRGRRRHRGSSKLGAGLPMDGGGWRAPCPPPWGICPTSPAEMAISAGLVEQMRDGGHQVERGTHGRPPTRRPAPRRCRRAAEPQHAPAPALGTSAGAGACARDGRADAPPRASPPPAWQRRHRCRRHRRRAPHGWGCMAGAASRQPPPPRPTATARRWQPRRARHVGPTRPPLPAAPRCRVARRCKGLLMTTGHADDGWTGCVGRPTVVGRRTHRVHPWYHVAPAAPPARPRRADGGRARPRRDRGRPPRRAPLACGARHPPRAAPTACVGWQRRCQGVGEPTHPPAGEWPSMGGRCRQPTAAGKAWSQERGQSLLPPPCRAISSTRPRRCSSAGEPPAGGSYGIILAHGASESRP